MFHRQELEKLSSTVRSINENKNIVDIAAFQQLTTDLQKNLKRARRYQEKLATLAKTIGEFGAWYRNHAEYIGTVARYVEASVGSVAAEKVYEIYWQECVKSTALELGIQHGKEYKDAFLAAVK